jgi:hypothetical protein
MSAYFASLGALDLVFFSLAAVGGALLLIRAILNIDKMEMVSTSPLYQVIAFREKSADCSGILNI